MNTDQVWTMGASELAALIRARQLSSEELTRTLCDRIATVNRPLNAIVQMDVDLALRQARLADQRLAQGGPVGPLHGVPVTLKDSIEVRGLISAAGTMGRAHHRPSADATVVTRLRGAGAVILGKTNVPEFALAVETDNLLYGRTNNPYDVERTCGGSSGGPAAAVAAGMVPLDIGSDGGASIRLPAHYCGVAALKATTGRISQAGHFPEGHGPAARLLAQGPLARRVRDLRLALEVLEGEDLADPLTVPLPSLASEQALAGLRVAFFTDDGICPATPETVATVRRCAAALERAGCRVNEAVLPGMADASEVHLGFIIHDRHMIREWIREAGTPEEQLHPWVTAGLAYMDEAAADLPADFGTMLFYEQRRLQKQAMAFMRAYDVILSPVAARPAPLHGQGVEGASFSAYGYANVHNLTGWPAATVRCGTSPEGLPIGVQIAALPFRDQLTLTVAEFLESELGGWQPPPALVS
jgi:amidase